MAAIPPAPELVFRIAVIIAGIALFCVTIDSAVRTFVLPRAATPFVTRAVFVWLRRVFELAMKPAKDFATRDGLLAMYAPTGLLLLPVVWFGLVGVAFAFVFRGIGAEPSWREAFRLSGSSLFTLGFEIPHGIVAVALTFFEALCGLALLALLISYLPTIYSAFSRRERDVALLETRAGSPPSALTMFERYWRIGFFDKIHESWADWEEWFADLDESHTSLAALTFLRSPLPTRSWVTAGGCVMDAAALVLSTLDAGTIPEAALCLRMGFLTFRRIADYFGIPIPDDPQQGDPISITRAEYDAAYDRLSALGIPLRPDRDQAWLDFAGWRVNYDAALLGLCALTMAPAAPWSGDRAPALKLPKVMASGLLGRRRRKAPAADSVAG